MIAKLEESQKNAERDWNEAEALRKQSEKLHRELQRQIIEFNEERDERLLKAQKEGKKSRSCKERSRRHYSRTSSIAQSTACKRERSRAN